MFSEDENQPILEEEKASEADETGSGTAEDEVAELLIPEENEEAAIMEDLPLTAQEKIQSINETLDENKGAMKNLGEFARDRVFEVDEEAREEIYKKEKKFIFFKRERTDEETMKAAETVFNQRMEKMQTEGLELAKSKQELSDHDKDTQTALDLIEDPDKKFELSEKLKEESEKRHELIEQKNEELEGRKEAMREPFLERKEELESVQKSLAETVKEVAEEGKKFADKIKDLNNRLKTAGKLKLLGEAKAEIVKDFEAQKKEAEDNLKKFNEQKTTIDARLKELKDRIKETNQVLERIDNVGKTDKEIRAEKAEKAKKAAEKANAGKPKSSEAKTEAKPKSEAKPKEAAKPEAGGAGGGDGGGNESGTEGKKEKALPVSVEDWIELFGYKNETEKNKLELYLKQNHADGILDESAARKNMLEYLTEEMELDEAAALKRINERISEFLR